MQLSNGPMLVADITESCSGCLPQDSTTAWELLIVQSDRLLTCLERMSNSSNEAPISCCWCLAAISAEIQSVCSPCWCEERLLPHLLHNCLMCRSESGVDHLCQTRLIGWTLIPFRLHALIHYQTQGVHVMTDLQAVNLAVDMPCLVFRGTCPAGQGHDRAGVKCFSSKNLHKARCWDHK